MNPTDHLRGSFEFETTFHKDGPTFVARALGKEARHVDQWQALNDLNEIVNTAIEKGEIVPTQDY